MKNILKTKENISSKKTVYVGMSGGVDSSVTAALLKEAGYDVTGVFIKVWQPDSTDCGWKDERRDAMRVAAVLDIPFLTFDFSEQYKKEVVDYMISEYKAGRTPNPDIMCNRYVKFGSFLDEAKRRGVDFVATGHYAQNVLENGIYSLKEGVDSGKDQSYFLWTLNQNDLKHILFPVGNLQKSEVRKLAEKFKLPFST
jgi:tRNA-specific 2-thiouridylase